MPDDFGCYDEEVERRIKMSRPIYPRPKPPLPPPKPFATVNIVGSITDPANIAKIKEAYEKEEMVMVRPTHPPVKCHKPPAPASGRKQEPEYEYIDEETELTREIAEAAKKAGIPTEGLNIPKPSPPKNVQIMSGTGWLGPG